MALIVKLKNSITKDLWPAVGSAQFGEIFVNAHDESAQLQIKVTDGAGGDEMRSVGGIIARATEPPSALNGTVWYDITAKDLKLRDAGAWLLLSAASASESVKGIAEIATQLEVDSGSDDERIVTPAKLNTYVTAAIGAIPSIVDASETDKGIAEIATQTEVDAFIDDTRIVTPAKLKKYIHWDHSGNGVVPRNLADDVYVGGAVGSPNIQLKADGSVTAETYAVGAVPGIDFREGKGSSDGFGGSITKEWTKGLLTKAEMIVGYRIVIDTRLVDPANADYQVKANGSGDYTFDWGDGNVETKAKTSTWTEVHTYSSPGEYTVTITYSDPNSSIQPVPSTPTAAGSHLIKSVTGMSSYLNQTLTTYSNSWQNSINMTSVHHLTYGPNLTSMSSSFNNCTKLTSFPFEDVPWSQLTILSITWSNCNAISNIPQGPLDLSNVTTLAATWQRNYAMSGPWPEMITTSALTGINSTWRDNAGITGEFPLFDTSGVTNASYAWANTSISGAFPAFDLGECLNAASMLNGTKITSWPSIDMPKCKTFTSAWSNCTELTSWGLSDMSSGENMASAWTDCSKLTAMPAGITFPAATSFNGCWGNCTLLTDFPANAFDTTGTLVSLAFNNTFSSCALTATSIENILVSLDANGQTGISLGLNGGTNAAKTTWTAAANTAYDNLVNNKAWTIANN